MSAAVYLMMHGGSSGPPTPEVVLGLFILMVILTILGGLGYVNKNLRDHSRNYCLVGAIGTGLTSVFVMAYYLSIFNQ